MSQPSSRHSKESKRSRQRESRGSRETREKESNSRRNSKESNYSKLSRNSRSSRNSPNNNTIIENLTRDKKKLKERLGKLLDEFEDRKERYKNELFRTKSYYETHIQDLNHKIENIKTESHRYVEKSIKKIKQIYEHRHNQKNNQEIERLENIIANLHERLNNQITEFEAEKSTMIQHFSHMEEKFQQQAENLQSQLQKEREIHAQDRQEASKLMINIQSVEHKVRKEKDKEKQDEIEKIKQKVSDQLIYWEKKAKSLEINLEEKNSEYNNEITQMSQRLQQLQVDQERNLNEVKRHYKQEINNINEHYKRQLLGSQKDGEEKLNELSEKFTKQLQTEKYDHQKQLNVERANSTQRINELESVKSFLQEKVDSLRLQVKTMILEREKELEEDYNTRLQLVESKCKTKLEIKQREINNILLNRDKLLGDANDIREQLNQRIVDLEAELEKSKHDYQFLKAEASKHNKNQRALFNEEILKRDKHIEALDRNLKKLGLESIDQIQRMDKRIKQLEREHDKQQRTAEEKSSKLVELQETHRQTSEQLYEYKKMKEHLDNEIIQLQQDFQREKARLVQQNDAVFAQLNNSTVIIQNYKREMGSADFKIKTLQENIAKRDVDIARYKEKLNLTIEQGARIEVLTKDYEKKIAQYEQQLIAKDQEYNTAQKHITDMGQQLEKIKGSVTPLHNEVIEYKRRLVEANQTALANLEQFKKQQNETENIQNKLVEWERKYQKLLDEHSIQDELVNEYRTKLVQLKEKCTELEYNLGQDKQDAIDKTTQNMRNYMNRILKGKEREILKLKQQLEGNN